MINSNHPALVGNVDLLLPAPAPPSAALPSTPATSLVDLLYDGLYMVFLLRNGKTPGCRSDFSAQVQNFLDEFEREAKLQRFDPEDIHDAKYAFSALIDETVLSSAISIRAEWARQPLQLTLFGDQLAGEHFFERLEHARNGAGRRLAALEVFYMCLLLGFKGKYLLEGSEKLNYLSAQLGDQITHIKARHTSFAPHWRAPDNIVHTLRRKLPMWALLSTVIVAGSSGYLALKTYADKINARELAPYQSLISYSRKAPHITVTLP